MARPPRGQGVIEQARAYRARAKTAEELRMAQAVLLPLELGLSLQQTAQAIGKSLRWTTELRGEFIQRGGPPPSDRPTRGGRYRQNMSPAEEAEFLAPFLNEAKEGGILVVGKIKVCLEARLGRTVALASVYNLLHRHGWRKLAPDKRNPKTDVAAQEDWKKTPRNPR